MTTVSLVLAVLAIADPSTATSIAAPTAAPPPTATPPRAATPPASVRVASGPDGARLLVNGFPFQVRGVNWDYFPIGTNYSYSLWTQPDDVIEAALANELPLLKRMGANTIRVYAGIPRRWIRYIHEKYGIWTVLNHTVGRYGYDLDGAWIASVDYSSPRFRAAVKAEIAALVDGYKDTPGLLMWLLGNENNYGLSWSSFEIEALPKGERDVARARYLYSLFGEIIRDVKARDPGHPVAIANGDLQYIDLVASECRGLDVFGANVYRGASFRDLFDVVKAKLGVPVLFTEFGADAYDAKRGREDDVVQARYLLANWREIYEESAGKGRAGNAIGGLVFQWSDGWWKYKQDTNLDVHDTNASWPNAGYAEDYVEGENNMNEEWWGICAKAPPDARGLYALQPRTAYYVLQKVFRLDPYAPGVDRAAVETWFDGIAPVELAFHYQAARAAALGDALARVRLSELRFSSETYSTGGDRRWKRTDVPNQGRGFDHTESMYLGGEIRPTSRMTASATLNILGNVARNPIDELTYERRGRPVGVVSPGAVDPSGITTLADPDRVRIYRASLTWEEDRFRVDGFYRSGHYHWASEGDVFGLYREANYGEAIDIYDAPLPAGFEITGKRELDGVKLAFGPALWWGANPTLIGKYRRAVGGVTLTVVHQEDVAQGSAIYGLAAAIPEVQQRKTTLALETRVLGVGLELGGIVAGAAKVGRAFLDEQNRPHLVRDTDTVGGRARLTWERGTVHWYAQGAYMGLVADGGPEPRITYTGWTLKDSGSGNQVNALTGAAVTFGWLQVGPNFLWQKPLVGPGRSVLPFAGGGTASRNVQSDPFAVRGNRETVGAELMLAFDPTPATWMFAWDNDLREDAPIAAAVDVSYRHQPTPVDAGFYFGSDGIRYAFPAGVPARDVWEIGARVVSAPRPNLRLVVHGFGGNPQGNGDNARQPRRYGGDFRVTWGPLAVAGHARFNDFGAYDYYRDFVLTYPLQLMGDVSWNLGPARWLWQQQTRIGIRATQRWLNAYSNRYVFDRADPRAWGNEYEVRTYLVFSL
jgi:hypothetical protein